MAASLTLKIGEFKEGEKNEEFPKDKEGERCKVDIGDFTKDNTSLTDKVIESIVLTLLKKEGNIFSLSIKLKKNSNITSSTLNAASIYGEKKYIYKNTDESTTKLYNVSRQGDVKLTHILIIGTATDNSANFTFTVTKSIFVTNTTAEQLTTEVTPFHELLTIEEFLNLRYIDYFSFDNEKFNELYKGILQGGGGISTKIKNKSK
jgi:hypothetical protein